MQSLRDLKRRIRSVKNIGQITKAMEMVSMTKMRRSQVFALQARPYALAAFELFENLLTMLPASEPVPKLLSHKPDVRELLIIVTSDKGLAGAFNEAVIRRAFKWIAEHELLDKDFALIAVGKKGKDALERKGHTLAGAYTGFGDHSTIKETTSISSQMIAGFLKDEWSGVSIVSTHFRTTLKQEMVLNRILPVTKEGLEEAITSLVPEYGRYHDSGTHDVKEAQHYEYKYIFEPSPKEILDALLPNLLKVHFHYIILESNASEHSARMVAMKAASDNARELGGELTLVYNKARQAGITQELSEVVAGQLAQE